MGKYDRIIFDFIESGQTVNRRKVEELLSSLNKSKKFKQGVNELYVEIMRNGTNEYIDSVEKNKERRSPLRATSSECQGTPKPSKRNIFTSDGKCSFPGKRNHDPW